MFDIFKKNQDEKPADVKRIRDEILIFIKERLKKLQGGEGQNIKGIQVYVACQPDDRSLYESALYFDETDRFKNEEVQRLADDYAVDLPAEWTMEILFQENLPKEAVKIPGVDAALFIVTRKTAVQKTSTAYIKIRSGHAEKAEYPISSSSGRVCIGREKKVLTSGGFYRENNIAFTGSSDANKFVSRQHAHIEFDNDSGCFILYADEGGVPPRNKMKVRSLQNDQPVKLYSTGIGHRLQEGDQILLGESALLEFSYKPDEKEL
jgi:hypothetical protein